jgi:hypothetical protein
VDLDFETLAVFISTHAASRTELLQAFISMPHEDDKSSDDDSVQASKSVVQSGLEAALGPLLAGFPATVAGNGRVAGVAARYIARRAAALALQGGRQRPTLFGSGKVPSASAGVEDELVGLDEFAELFRKAAAIARISVMHLTGDVGRWRNCIASPSPRVDLRHSFGGG